MIIFLYGEDSFRSTRKLGEIREKFYRDVDPTRTNTHVFDAQDKGVSFENIYGAIGSLGFFSAKRLVIVKNLLARKNLAREVAEYLSSAPPIDDVILVFWEPGVPDKRSGLWKRLSSEEYAQEFAQLRGGELAGWISGEVSARGGETEKELAILLAQAYPDDMWRLSGEIDKLIAFGGGREITKELVEDFSYTAINTNIFDFVDSITSRDDARLAELFKNMLEAENELYVLAMTHRQFRLLYQAKRLKESLRSPNELAKEIGVHPYVAKKLWRQAEGATLKDIQRGIDHLVRAELDIKTGRATPALALEMVLFGHA